MDRFWESNLVDCEWPSLSFSVAALRTPDPSLSSGMVRRVPPLRRLQANDEGPSTSSSSGACASLAAAPSRATGASGSIARSSGPASASTGALTAPLGQQRSPQVPEVPRGAPLPREDLPLPGGQPPAAVPGQGPGAPRSSSSGPGAPTASGMPWPSGASSSAAASGSSSGGPFSDGVEANPRCMLDSMRSGGVAAGCGSISSMHVGLDASAWVSLVEGLPCVDLEGPRRGSNLEDGISILFGSPGPPSPPRLDAARKTGAFGPQEGSRGPF